MEEAEVSRELAKLNPQTASGPDNITTKIETSCASQLSAPLTRIDNRGINEACFTGVWKLAKVVAYLRKNITTYLRITDQLPYWIILENFSKN